VTGSVGKTTTKDMVASVLAQKFKVLKNEENLNNEIGLPLTVLKLGKDAEAAVLEMAMRQSGEIRQLAEIAAPEVGIITNIGLAHIELLKTRQNIARVKSELIEVLGEKFLPAGGLKKPVIILNSDDDFYKTFVRKARRYKVRVISFGIASKAQFTAEEILPGPESISFVLKAPAARISVHLPQPGKHNVYNALAAAGAGAVLGLSLKQVKTGLESFVPSSARMEIINTPRIKILNDTYNASPDSMKAAIKILQEQRDFLGKSVPRKIAVLGDMLELGNFTTSAHRQIGEYLVENGIHLLVAVGKNSFYIGQGALNAGMSEKNIYFSESVEEAGQHLLQLIRKGDVVLVKGSRDMKMEKIVVKLKKY
jgi:UDP-N-acetylmuramoyl-tripeptide--D-alanyl-D-alanine ligase